MLLKFEQEKMTIQVETERQLQVEKMHLETEKRKTELAQSKLRSIKDGSSAPEDANRFFQQFC